MYIKEAHMKTMTFTEFRQHATSCLNAVEEGESIRILRHGKPVADLVPVKQQKVPSWKRLHDRAVLRGVSLSAEIVKEREEYGR
jgi:prevent-host-death family protein